MKKTYHFFVGGYDLEMIEVVKILIEQKINFDDLSLSWADAKVSAYEKRITEMLKDEFIPVLLELKIDISLPKTVVIIDHHNECSSNPATILQVLNLLGLQPTRLQSLIAANDSGAYWGLKTAGANSDEVHLIRQLERSMQGFTPAMELISIKAAKTAFETNPILPIVRLPFSSFAAAKDYIWERGGKEMVFIAADGEVEYQGCGITAAALLAKFPAGWAGGEGFNKANNYASFFGAYIGEEILENL